MLATLNSRQIVDEIVKDTIKDNDPHDAVQISPEIVLASRPDSVSPALAPEITPRPEPKMNPEPKLSPVLEQQTLEPRISEPQAAAPSVDTTVRVAPGDGLSRQKRSSAGKWLRGAFVTFLFAGGSVAATLAWEKHGDTAKQMLAEWTPALASLMPSTSQTAPVAAAQAAPSATQAATDQVADPSAQTADPSAPPPAPQLAAAPPAASETDAAPSVQSMTRDLAAMAQQIEQLKANIAELKAGQEQMAREMTKPPAPRPVAETRPIDPRARVSAVPPRPAAPPVRKPKPVVSQTYAPARVPAPLAPPPPSSQAIAAPPPVAPVTTTQAVADDDGPVVRPPMPVH